MPVQFEEGDFYSSQTPQSEQVGFVTRIFLKIGLGKDHDSSKIAMLVVAVICFALAIFFFTR